MDDTIKEQLEAAKNHLLLLKRIGFALSGIDKEDLTSAERSWDGPTLKVKA